MPTDDCKKTDNILYVCGSDGEYHRITPVDIEDACGAIGIDESEVFETGSDSMEISFSINLPDGMTFSDMVLILLGFDEHKIKQNNWRKMHGLSMKRKYKRKRVKKDA